VFVTTALAAGVNEFIISNYKQTWGGIRKISDAPESVKHLTLKSHEYATG
jgi:arsenite oxidase large subunit